MGRQFDVMKFAKVGSEGCLINLEPKDHPFLLWISSDLAFLKLSPLTLINSHYTFMVIVIVYQGHTL